MSRAYETLIFFLLEQLEHPPKTDSEDLSCRRTVQWLRKFIQLGWREDFVTSTFASMNDSLLGNWPELILIEEIAKQWIEKHDFVNTIHESLEGIGLRPEVAMELEGVVEPLLGSSYTHTQVLDVAIEYLLGHYAPLYP